MRKQMHNRLLEPYLLGDLNLPNRIVMAPLTRTRADNPGHIPTSIMSVRRIDYQRGRMGQ